MLCLTPPLLDEYRMGSSFGNCLREVPNLKQIEALYLKNIKHETNFTFVIDFYGLEIRKFFVSLVIYFIKY